MEETLDKGEISISVGAKFMYSSDTHREKYVSCIMHALTLSSDIFHMLGFFEWTTKFEKFESRNRWKEWQERGIRIEEWRNKVRETTLEIVEQSKYIFGHMLQILNENEFGNEWF